MAEVFNNLFRLPWKDAEKPQADHEGGFLGSHAAFIATLSFFSLLAFFVADGHWRFFSSSKCVWRCCVQLLALLRLKRVPVPHRM
jgi:hypothetical protein